jgi:nucleoside-diphosphate-sugar epimerase
VAALAWSREYRTLARFVATGEHVPVASLRMLVLGGTVFLGRAIAACARAAGHEVTCAARGVSGSVPDGVRLVPVDRDAPDGLAALGAERFDAVVDVSRHPGQVRRALADLRSRAGHWTFVSTVSVYADKATPGQRAATAPLVAPALPEIERGDDDAYAAAKVACEQAVGDDAFICRAGLIVGPEDPTGRFSYWPARLARGGEVLVPSTDAAAPVQMIDARDLAAWIVRAAETGLRGTYDGTGPALPFADFVEGAAAAIGAPCTFARADRAFLEGQGVKRWAGPRSLPVWVPRPEFEGFLSRDVTESLAAGLRVRDLADTARDTLAWLRAGGGPITGVTAEEESDILRAWHGRAAGVSRV